MISKEKKKEYDKKFKELHLKKRESLPKISKQICLMCKKDYTPSRNRPNQKYCSRKCSGSGNAQNLGKHAKPQYLSTPGKICPGCNKQKPFADYRKLKKTSGWKAQDGSRRYSSCKECERLLMSIRYRKDPTLQVWNSLKINAKKNGFPFEITKEYLRSIIQDAPKVCPALGIPMVMSEYGKHKGKNANSPSIDKIIPELGYVEGNLIVITDMANRIKTNATPEQIIKVGEFYKKLLEKK